MAEEDNGEYRRRISAVLEQHGFNWVVAQTEAQIAEGKQTSKQVSEQEVFQASSDSDFVLRRPRQRRASLITSEPYSELEQLNILLDAIEAALIQRATLELAIIEQFPDVKAIHFEPEELSEGFEASYVGKSHRIDAHRRDLGAQIEREAASVLAQIRGRDRART